MNLYKNKKDQNTLRNELQYMEIQNSDFFNKRNTKSNVSISGIITNTYNKLKDLVRSSTLAGIIIPSIFVITGFLFIYQQFFPDIKQLIEKNSNYLDQGNVSPVTDKYINVSQYISNPSGLTELTKTALKENILQKDDASLAYSGTFYISIPSLGMNRLPVTANVDSSSEAAYNAVLTNTLAHFRSTGLPISPVENNIVVYGHSASPNYGPKASDPYVAFSFLPEIKVGDDIYINISNQEYHFKTYRNKIVEPNDTSIITGVKGTRTLTLFTCFPLGSNTQRFVSVAREV
ncbi:MAG: sortase [Candidatus Dojkabacteria bacterium]